MFWKSVALRQCIHIVQVFIFFKYQMKNSKIAVSDLGRVRIGYLCGFLFFGVGLILCVVFVCFGCLYLLVGCVVVWFFLVYCFFGGVCVCFGG